jgi:hypothetical protein
MLVKVGFKVRVCDVAQGADFCVILVQNLLKSEILGIENSRCDK